jgi:sRNA-binding carbon storage regulator CsrA
VGNLILKRRPKEAVFIECGGNMLSVNVVEIRGDSVRLGFVGTRAFTILRGEILQREEAKHRPPGATGAESESERSRAAAIVPLDSLRLSVSAVALTPASVGSPT